MSFFSFPKMLKKSESLFSTADLAFSRRSLPLGVNSKINALPSFSELERMTRFFEARSRIDFDVVITSI